jgi:hypothetical protein
MALDEKGCASSRAWVPVHCITSVEHYSSTLASSFVFFYNKVDPCAYPTTMSMPDIFLNVLCETKSGITHQFMARKFLNFSYLCMGRGTRSKQPTFVSQEAVALLYALKVAYLIFCSKLPDNQASVETAVTMAKQLLNQGSDSESTFKAVKRIKNQAKSCIASWSTTPITWVQGAEMYSSLTVETGKGKYSVSHSKLAHVYEHLMLEVSEYFNVMQIPTLAEEELFFLKDASSVFEKEGLASFNTNVFPLVTQDRMFNEILLKNKLPEFLTACASLGLNLLCLIHLAGGPGARAAEECFFTIRNSASCIRHIRMLGSSVVVIPDYCKQRKMSYKQPSIVVKFLPLDLGVAIASYIIFVKELEARVVTHLTKNASDGESVIKYGLKENESNGKPETRRGNSAQ